MHRLLGFSVKHPLNTVADACDTNTKASCLGQTFKVTFSHRRSGLKKKKNQNKESCSGSLLKNTGCSSRGPKFKPYCP